MESIAPATVLVLSHLRYDFVFQRPQQIMHRLARRHRIVFVEEPVRTDGPPRLRTWQPTANVLVLEPQTPLAAPGFHDAQLPMLRELLEPEFAKLDRPVLWFYTPMALPLVAEVPARRVVYDCMDELAAFRFAPLQLGQREEALLRRADHVFTGGRSLHRLKRTRHPDVRCFPSAVDARHFATPVEAGDPAPGVERPRIGYCGVIDERIDYDLLERVATERPDWQWFMVGPFVKVDPATRPQRPNLHWVGQQAFESLPRLLASWDVCMMPFVLDETTRHISPTKTLEYMAAGKPIVSTRIRDVAEPYGQLVHVADGPAAFLSACEAVLAESAAERERRAGQMRDLAADLDWDDTVAAMEAIVFGGPGDLRATAAAAAAGVTEREDVCLEWRQDPGDVIDTASGSPVVRIDTSARTVHAASGEAVRYGSLVTRVPLPRLLRLFERRPPRGVRQALASLQDEHGLDTNGREAANAAEKFGRNVARICLWLGTLDIHPDLEAREDEVVPQTLEPVHALR